MKARKASRNTKSTRRGVVPLHLAEDIISYDTLATIRHLEELTQSGDCLGIAFGAILRGGRTAHGVTGAAIEQPVIAAGILSQVIFKINSDAESG